MCPYKGLKILIIPFTLMLRLKLFGLQYNAKNCCIENSVFLWVTYFHHYSKQVNYKYAVQENVGFIYMNFKIPVDNI